MKSNEKQIFFYTIITILIIFVGFFYYSTISAREELDKQIKENEVKVRTYESRIENLQKEVKQKSITIEELINETNMNFQMIEELETEITLLDTAVHMIGISDIETILLEYAQMKIDYQKLQDEHNELLRKCDKNQ
jgi:hypothetical protein